MRICITGSRHWTNEQRIRNFLVVLVDFYGINLEIAHGKSKGGGVDLMVEKICDELGIIQWPFPVRAGKTGIDGPNFKVAPLNRNVRMLKSFMPDLVLAFRASGKSSGTDHTCRAAKELGIDVFVIREDEPFSDEILLDALTT